MRITRITVRNFRNLADVDIRLQPGAVIVGENRAGKTNLISRCGWCWIPPCPTPTVSSEMKTSGTVCQMAHLTGTRWWRARSSKSRSN